MVKFVNRLLAKEHLAPELFYYGKIGCMKGDPSYGHLRMVAMTARQSISVKQLPSTFLHDIRRALKILHEKDYVLGTFQGQTS